MDDMQELRAMRADPPGPSTDVLARVQVRLFREAAAPVRRRRRFAVPLVAAGAVGLTAAVVATTVQSGPEPDPGSPVAAAPAPVAVLENAAKVAERRAVATVPEPKQWVYTKSLDKVRNGEKRTTESWSRVDGRGTALFNDGKLKISMQPKAPTGDDLPAGGMARKLRELPTDPAALLEHVRGDKDWDASKEKEASAAEHPDHRAFRLLGVYLREQAVMPPKLEAAIYRAMRMIPQVKIEQNVADAAGRRGIAVSHDRDKIRMRLVLDSESYRYLGRADVALQDIPWPSRKSDFKVPGDGYIARKGETMTTTALLKAVVVDKPGAVR